MFDLLAELSSADEISGLAHLCFEWRTEIIRQYHANSLVCGPRKTAIEHWSRKFEIEFGIGVESHVPLAAHEINDAHSGCVRIHLARCLQNLNARVGCSHFDWGIDSTHFNIGIAPIHGHGQLLGSSN